MPYANLDAILEEGALLERAGRWNEAHARYSEAFHQAFRQRRVEGILRAVLVQTRVLWQSSRHDAAQELAELGVELARLAESPRSVARFLNLLGVILHSREEWEEARGYYVRALEYARDDGDDELIAGICPNLGVVANSLGNLREARALYLEGISACVRCGNALWAGIAYNNLGMVCADLEEWTEADLHFLRGVEIADRLGDVALMARLLTGRAEPLIHCGNFAAARDSLDRAEALAEELEDTRSLADAQRYRGLIALAEGALDRAESHLERALAIATEARVELERAETLEALACLRHAQRRRGAAGALLREARRAFEELGAARDIDRLDGLRAAWDAPAPGPTPPVSGNS